jgi:NTE family protein
MAVWDPGRVRQQYGLVLSDEQKQAIRAKLPPSPEPGVYFADGVYEGGGVLGLAFLGAARCRSEIGIRWKGLAGTSAGAITASLLAADLPIDRLEALVGNLDFMHFLSRKSHPLILTRDPSRELNRPGWMILNLLLTWQLGGYSSDPFKEWLTAALAEGGVTAFADVGRSDPQRELKVVISDITDGLMKVLPDDLPKDQAKPFAVAEAVRLSMSIPFFFEPGRLGDAVIVDGGILSNFPIWIYDEPDPQKRPEWPTFGFRLADRRVEGPATVTTAAQLAGAMVKTMMYASDRHYLSQRNLSRIINIDITEVGVSVTQFNLTDEQKDQLYRNGYEATRAFFLKDWSWAGHLRLRNFH